jgi:hypothetical protein
MPGDTLDIDASLNGTPTMGSLIYENPDGSVVTVDFAFDEAGAGSGNPCVVAGTAIGW